MSETDDQTPRRRPTIELAATEVANAADKPAAGDVDTSTTGVAADATAESSAPASASSGRRFTSHIASALVGAAVMAAAAAALWFTGVIPSREAAPAATATSDTSAAPANPAPNPPPSPAPAAATQNNSITPDLKASLDKIDDNIERQAQLAGQTKTLGDNLAALTRRVDEIAATAQSAAKQADTALNAAETARGTSEVA